LADDSGSMPRLSENFVSKAIGGGRGEQKGPGGKTNQIGLFGLKRCPLCRSTAEKRTAIKGKRTNRRTQIKQRVERESNVSPSKTVPEAP